MNDRDLRGHLDSLEVPGADETVRGRALHRATAALAHPDDSGLAEAGLDAWRGARGWLALCAVMLVAGLLMIGPFRPQPETDGGADLRTLAQVEELFPGQLNAVIEKDGGVQIDLAGRASATAGEQPVLVQFERGGRRLRVLSYSGRSITLELKGETFTFEALVTGDGGVVLSGDDFAWSSAQPRRLAGYKIQARPLVTS